MNKRRPYGFYIESIRELRLKAAKSECLQFLWTFLFSDEICYQLRAVISSAYEILTNLIH